MFKTSLLATVLALAAPFALAGAGPSTGSTASDKILIGTMSIVAAPAVSVAGSAKGNGPVDGSVVAVMGGGYLVTGIVQGAAQVVEVALTSIGSSAKLSVKLSGKAVETVGLSVGATVQVISETTGTLLVASGKVIAFIPNALGEALLSQQRLPAN